MRIVVCSGGMDPVHSGHISFLQAASKLGDYLIVALNSDKWLTRKKGKPFMPYAEREAVLREFKCVNDVIEFDDDDNTARDALTKLKAQYPNDTIIFANGGDRNVANVPEMDIEGVEFVFGIGGNIKQNSSSWILRSWKEQHTMRPWGSWEVLREFPEAKVKELKVEHNQSLSNQRHKHRSEIWFVVHGTAHVLLNNKQTVSITVGQSLHIEKNQWHKLTNAGDSCLHIIEIQLGELCVEEDIERQ